MKPQTALGKQQSIVEKYQTEWAPVSGLAFYCGEIFTKKN